MWQGEGRGPIDRNNVELAVWPENKPVKVFRT